MALFFFHVCRANAIKTAERNSFETELLRCRREIEGIWDRMYHALYPEDPSCELSEGNLDMLTLAKRVLSRLSHNIKAVKTSRAKNAELKAKQTKPDVDDSIDDSLDLPYGLKMNLTKRIKTSYKLTDEYTEVIKTLQKQLGEVLQKAAEGDRQVGALKRRLEDTQKKLEKEKELVSDQEFMIEELQATLEEIAEDDCNSEEEEGNGILELVSTMEGGRYTTEYRTKTVAFG